MSSHLIPRNVEGENRILLIFSVKSFISTGIGAIIGILFYSLFKMLSLNIVGLVLLVLFSLIGFAAGAFKIPDSNVFNFFKKTGGLYLYDVVLRYVKFNKNKKIYIYKREENE